MRTNLQLASAALLAAAWHTATASRLDLLQQLHRKNVGVPVDFEWCVHVFIHSTLVSWPRVDTIRIGTLMLRFMQLLASNGVQVRAAAPTFPICI